MLNKQKTNCDISISLITNNTFGIQLMKKMESVPVLKLLFLQKLNKRRILEIKNQNIILKVRTLSIEHSVSECFLKITIFPISFSNAKWI